MFIVIFLISSVRVPVCFGVCAPQNCYVLFLQPVCQKNTRIRYFGGRGLVGLAHSRHRSEWRVCRSLRGVLGGGWYRWRRWSRRGSWFWELDTFLLRVSPLPRSLWFGGIGGSWIGGRRGSLSQLEIVSCLWRGACGSRGIHATPS